MRNMESAGRPAWQAALQPRSRPGGGKPRRGDLQAGNLGGQRARQPVMREMGGAPRNLALVRIVKSSGCHCTDGHLTSRVFTEDQKIS